MADVVSSEKRSAMMSAIRAKNTKPEMLVRKALFASGYRFRLHRKDLPGNPDVVLPGRKVAVFVHGCFWHAHDHCHLAKMPSTRPDFWQQKLEGNRQRDGRKTTELLAQGWRVLVVWECFLRKKTAPENLSLALATWVESNALTGELRANPQAIGSSPAYDHEH